MCLKLPTFNNNSIYLKKILFYVSFYAMKYNVSIIFFNSSPTKKRPV